MNVRIRTIFALAAMTFIGGSSIAISDAHILPAGASAVESATALAGIVQSTIEEQVGAGPSPKPATAYDLAVATGIPLAKAGLSDADFRELAGQGSNVIVPCAAASKSATEINAILAEAPSTTPLPCGGYNPDAPKVVLAKITFTPIAASGLPDADKRELLAAGFDSVGACEGESGVLSDALSSAGGTSWSCGYNSSTKSTY